MHGITTVRALPRRALTWLAALAALLVVALVSSLGATPAAQAAGGNGQGGNGQGGSGGQTTGSLYSDLDVLLRAENGTPILQAYTVPASESGEAATTELCAQPVSYERVPGVKPTVNPVDGREVWVIPLQGQWLTAPPAGGTPAELEACEPQPAYAMFVKEVELDRLNLTRTSDEVMERKTAAVATKLEEGTAIGLDAAGRIQIDGVPIDAAPEAASIYESILNTGTIPGLPAELAGPPAVVKQLPSEGVESHFAFNAWDLAAAALGTTASKETPITIDTVLYYDRILGFPAEGQTFPAGWNVSFNRSVDPLSPTEAQLTSGEQFVNFSNFSYNRSETFPGSVTWFNAETLRWEVAPILQMVKFTNIPAEPVGDRTLKGIQAFAQMADDVRAAILFQHEHETTPGFFMDRVGTDTTAAQLRAITDPAVSWSQLPSDVFQTEPFSVQASLFNPWGGNLIEHARVRVRIHAPGALTASDVAASSGGVPVPITAEGNGELTGWWGPPEGFEVKPGYRASTPFEVSIASGAPIGDYAITLELVDVSPGGSGAVLATDERSLAVHGNVPTVLWGGVPPKLVTQGTPVKLPLTVYEPAEANADLRFSIVGPSAEALSPDTLKAGDVSVYGEAETGEGETAMVAMPLSLDEGGHLVGTWPVALSKGYTNVVWYMTVAQGAPEGAYHLDAGLAGEVAGVEADMSVSAPETHGRKPPEAGEDALSLVLTPEFDLSSSVTVLLATEPVETGVSYYYQLTVNGKPGAWTQAVGGKVTVDDLAPGTYTLAVYATDAEGVDTAVKQVSWTVDAGILAPGPSPSPAPGVTPLPAPAPQPPVQRQEEQQKKTQARLTLRLGWMPGERLRLWGSVYPPHNGRNLVLQKRTRSGWKTVGRTRLQKATSTRSRYTATLAHATPGLYRVYLGADASNLASTSHAVRARARSHVTLRVQKLTRDRLRLSGVVRPRRDGEMVMLQLRTRIDWSTVASVRLRRAAEGGSAYSLTRGHLAPGVYRVRYGGDAGYRPSNSTQVTVR